MKITYDIEKDEYVALFELEKAKKNNKKYNVPSKLLEVTNDRYV